MSKFIYFEIRNNHIFIVQSLYFNASMAIHRCIPHVGMDTRVQHEFYYQQNVIRSL